MCSNKKAFFYSKIERISNKLLLLNPSIKYKKIIPKYLSFLFKRIKTSA